MAIRSHITGEQFIKSLEGLHFPDYAENRDLLAANPPGMLLPAQRLMNIMYENKLIRTKVDVASISDATPFMESKQ